MAKPRDNDGVEGAASDHYATMLVGNARRSVPGVRPLPTISRRWLSIHIYMHGVGGVGAIANTYTLHNIPQGTPPGLTPGYTLAWAGSEDPRSVNTPACKCRLGVR